jgi:hypothetical protein
VADEIFAWDRTVSRLMDASALFISATCAGWSFEALVMFPLWGMVIIINPFIWIDDELL